MSPHRLFPFVLAAFSLLWSGCSTLGTLFTGPDEKPKPPPQETQSLSLLSKAHAATVPMDRSEPEMTRSLRSLLTPSFHHDRLPDTLQFTGVKVHNSLLVGLLAHLVLWILYRSYRRAHQRRHSSLSQDDLAMVKIIRDNASRIYDTNRQKGKILKLHEFQK